VQRANVEELEPALHVEPLHRSPIAIQRQLVLGKVVVTSGAEELSQRRLVPAQDPSIHRRAASDADSTW